MSDTGKNTDNEHSSPIEFPCDFAIKIMGKQNDTFASGMHALVLQHFPQTPAANFTSRPSRDNNYLAITVTVHAQKKTEIDALYKDLSESPEVVMAL
jgi:uncharacterized protein